MGQEASTVKVDVNKLCERLSQEIIHPESDQWIDLKLLAASPENTLFLLKFKDIISIVTSQPINIATLIYKATYDLIQLKNYDAEFTAGYQSSIQQQLRILVRFIPPILACEDQNIINLIFFHRGALDTQLFEENIKKIKHKIPENGWSSQLR